MRTAISKKWSFDAAHVLPNHQGKCSQPHGHTYTVTVRVSGEVREVDGSSSEGMVCDFAVLDGAWDAVKPLLDHRDLNERVGMAYPITTSEHLATWLFGHFKDFLADYPDPAVADGVTVELVRVSETPRTYAEVRA